MSEHVTSKERVSDVRLAAMITYEKWHETYLALCELQERRAADGAAHEPPPALNKWSVTGICHAYESGFGDGVDGKANRNARPKDSHEHEAYDIGHRWGVERQEDLKSTQPPGVDLADAIENNNLKDVTIADHRSLLTDVAQILDGWKQTAPQDWTDWDQSVRERISAALTKGEG